MNPPLPDNNPSDNQNVIDQIDDFWSMSNKVQEEVYELFIKEINSKQ